MDSEDTSYAYEEEDRRENRELIIVCIAACVICSSMIGVVAYYWNMI